MKCVMCDTLFTPKRKTAKYCSEACKQRAKRNERVVVESPAISVPTMMVVEPSPPKMTISEGDFVYGSADDPNKTWDRGCVVCGHKFETPLELMRFCSGECRQNIMIALAQGPHKGFKL